MILFRSDSWIRVLRISDMTGFHFVEVSQRSFAPARDAPLFGWTGSGRDFSFPVQPGQPGEPFFPKCPFRMTHGLQCPGCGSTRALYQLLHLHPIAAVQVKSVAGATPPVRRVRLSRFTRSPSRQPTAALHSVDSIYGRGALMICFWTFANTVVSFVHEFDSPPSASHLRAN